MDPSLIPLQMKRNAKDTQDMFADLASWTTDIKKKDVDLKKGSNAGAKVLQDLRSRRQRKKHVMKVNSDGSEIESEGDDDETEEEERLALAEEYKNEGNSAFKEQDYSKAIGSYTLSLSLDPTNAVFAANRALAYMKQNMYQEAEDDCTRSLKHDSTYEKALFRRGQCRNQLGKIEGAVIDFKAVLKLNAKNREAKQILDKINSRLKQKVAWSLERPKGSSKIKFEHVTVTEKNGTEAVKVAPPEKVVTEEAIPLMKETPSPPKINEIKNEPISLTDETSCPPKINEISAEPVLKAEEKAEAFHFQAPKNSFELERDWRSMKTLTSKSKYLRIGPSDMLAAFFAPQLPKFLVEICSTLLHEIQDDLDSIGNQRFAIDFLTSISRVPRFSTAVFFMLDSEKKVVADLFELLQNAPSTLQNAFHS